MNTVDSLIEVRLASEEDFLKIKETLTRIGVASRKEKKLFQSCHILHKQGKYYIVHFKELFALDGKPSNFSDDDVARRNTIVNLLAEWELIGLVSPQKSSTPVAPFSQVKVITHKEKDEWELVAKYTIGKKR
ncbi:MAG: translational repressor RegA [Chitinophagaceae bacterium]